MAARKIQEVSGSAPASLPAVAPAAVGRQQTIVQVAGALLQSPRFASRITDERQQELMVRLAVAIADRILAAAAVE